MTMKGRMLYAFALTVLIIMVMGVIAMLIRWNIVPLLLSGALPAAIFAIAYLIAPTLSRYVKRG
jgi:hypothetical protein